MQNKTMFESMRLATGGGLKDLTEKVKQAKNTFSLVIGIGGTGFSALSTLREEVYEQVEPDGFDGEKPIYNHIRFLQIDSDGWSARGLDASEFFYMGREPFALPIPRDEPWFRWLNKDTTVDDARQGAGGVRQAGKLLLLADARELYNAISIAIRNGVSGLNAGFNINVYVMAGIGGGTGSGCFIDVCYIVQQVLSDLGYDGNAFISGFFFFPDVNLASGHFPTWPAYQDTVKTNGYAALQELDYLMGIPENGGRYEQQYNANFKISMAKPPVSPNLCYLISAATMEGAVPENGYDYAMRTVAEYILNYLVDAEASSQNNTLDVSATLQGLLPNLRKLIGQTRKDYGVNYEYNIIGSSCAIIPRQQIGTYLATKTLETVKYMKEAVPQRSDVEAFCIRTGFTYEALYAGVNEKVYPLSINPDGWVGALLKATKIGGIAKPLYEKCAEWMENNNKIIGKNIATMQRELDSYNPIEVPDTVLGKIFRKLVSIIENPDLGIYFAAGIMKGIGNGEAQAYTLDSVLQGIQEETTYRRDAAQAQQPYRIHQLNEAQEILINSREGLLSSIKKKEANYLKEVEAYYQNKMDIVMHNKMLDMLAVIKRNLEKLNRDYFEKYVRIFDTLFATFEDNAEFLGSNERQNRNHTWSVVNITSIRENLDALVLQYVQRDAIGNRIAPDLVRGMNLMMLRNQGSWLDEKEGKINCLFSSFIRSHYHNAFTLTMQDFLAEKYGATGTDLEAIISEKIICDGLVRRAVPNFHIDSTQFPIMNSAYVVPLFVLSVPQNEDSVINAAKRCRQAHNLQMGISQSVRRDRITICELYAGIPMYAYSALGDLKMAYEMHKNCPGIHLFEDEEGIDWRKLPSPLPATYTAPGYETPQSVLEAFDLLDEARKQGVVQDDRSADKAPIFRSKPFEVEETLTIPQDANLKELLKLLEEARAYKEQYENNKELFMELKSNGINYDTSIKDEFARRPDLIEAVKAELHQMDRVNDRIRELKELIAESEDVMKRQDDFIAALLRGSIVFENHQYKAVLNGAEGREEILLEDEETKAYAAIPVYRAYLAYQNLSEAIRTRIYEQVRISERDLDDETYQAAVSYRDFLTSVYIRYLENARTLENGKFIEKFINTVKNSVDLFVKNNV